MGIHDQDTLVTVNDPAHLNGVVAGNDCLVIIHRRDGLRLTRRIDLARPVLRIGRDTSNDVVLDDTEVSRRHARVEARGKSWVLMDVGSTNGTFLNDRELEGCEKLRRGDRLKIGSHIFKFLTGDDVESAYHDEIYRLSITDNLTGIPNRRALRDELAREFSRARRHTLPTSFLMIDIDRFKDVNDNYGHLAGDAVLTRVASTTRSATRDGDTVARYGGEEIAVLMPQTALEEAVVVAERVRAAIEALVIEYRGVAIRVTVSVGCAALRAEDANLDELVGRADDQLYAAKAAGRNCVAFAAPVSHGRASRRDEQRGEHDDARDETQRDSDAEEQTQALHRPIIRRDQRSKARDVRERADAHGGAGPVK
jgi:diguanylate cyclase (GGDEF)-like protein